MSASDHLGRQFGSYKLSFSQKEEEPWTEHTITAQHNNTDVGYLTWGHSGGVIDINVSKPHRRKGLATAMWHHANMLAGKQGPEGVRIPSIEHSGHRTQLGEAFAKSTGKAHYFPPKEIH